MATSTIKNLNPSINGVSLVPGNNYTSADLKIGTVQVNSTWSTAKTVANNTTVVYSNFNLTAGIWLITLRVDWPTTGGDNRTRTVWLSPNNATTDAGGQWTQIGEVSLCPGYQVPGCSSMNPTNTGTVLAEFSTTTTVYIKLQQNSGSSVSVSSVAVHCVKF